jgi:hypothetical protein
VQRWTKVDGIDVLVEGTLENSEQSIRFDRKTPYNAKAIADAKAKAREREEQAKVDTALKAALRPKTEPAARPGELILHPQGPAVPSKAQPIGQGIKNYGVEPDKLGQTEKVTAHSPEAQAFMQSLKSRESDGDKLHVKVIGSDEARSRVVEDLKNHPTLSPLKAQLLVQDYDPKNWAIDPSLGFSANGAPTILIQSGKSPSDPKGGKVLWRAENYQSGPEGLATAIVDAQAEALRKSDPVYKPNLDPGPGRGKIGGGCPLGFSKEHWPFIVIVAGVVAFVALTPNPSRTATEAP